MNIKLIASIIVGAILAFIADHILFVGSALTLIPWAIIGIVLGLWNKSKKEALINGFVYGFILSFLFMIFGYEGVSGLLGKALVFFVLLGVFGGICGSILGFIGTLIYKLVNK